MDAFLKKLKAARKDPRDFLPPPGAAQAGEGAWNVPLINDFWQVVSDPAKCNFDLVFLNAIHAVLRQLDLEPRTSSRIAYSEKTKQRQPLIFDGKKPLFGIPLWLHSLGVAVEVILTDKEERVAEAAKSGTKLNGQVIAGSTLAVKVIAGLAHDLGKQESILKIKISQNDLAVGGVPSISKRQHALYSSQVFLHAMEQNNCLSPPSYQKIRGRIEVAIMAHHEPFETLPRVVQIQNAGALDITYSLIECDGKSRAIESCRPRIVRPEHWEKNRKKDH